MTAKRLMLLSLFCSVLGISVLLLSQTNSESATTSSKQAVKQTVKVLVPTRTIEIGQAYTPNSFRWKEVPQQELENYIDHVTPEDISADHSMSGLARTKLVKDSILSKADITEPEGGYSLSLKLQPGYRAISVPVDQVTSNSGFIEPGDRVDILLLGSQDGELLRYGNSSQGLYVTTIAHDVRVLAFNDKQTAESYQKARESNHYENGIPDDSSVSLEVTPEQANQVVLAKQLGKLTLVLRGQNEDPNQTQNANSATLKAISPDTTQVLPDVGLVEFRADNKTINNKTGADNNG
ncbi:Flp pilus assembly protein CpaB [Vibrio sp. 10N.286.55.E10]|uniref:Flp pilus assembly protein CpaB n=1 Tax=Vibrio TaxID=662 RepID=UPI000C82AF48|nr:MULTISPECIES: Flp pilus assembly protein CpaB [unclassified Vibrio]CAK3133343.1 pilus assembly protein CpaB [Vibrio crassostreae]PME28346.1 Flp pilus assembly protein CpaB [Vibrio sp. 10N.286.55.E12]PME38839.1 Flp pilus assembly protein CpaB [Vibrio sp. 10N.286.55.E10]PME68280.1 Flp pilus assembly protein CpaB [Vibrio sp. 10N.286.55.C11]PMI22156.1 Flp pilus assembly protein CpaB [Vibrio sp. 10N.286.46.E10]